MTDLNTYLILGGFVLFGFVLGRWGKCPEEPLPEWEKWENLPTPPRVTTREVELQQEVFVLRQQLAMQQHDIWHLERGTKRDD